MAPSTTPSRSRNMRSPWSSGPRCATAHDIDATTRSASRTPSAAAIPHMSAVLHGDRKRAREDARESRAETRVRERVIVPATGGITHAAPHGLVREQAKQCTGDGVRVLAWHKE